MATNFLPPDDELSNLGSTSNKWKKLYAVTLDNNVEDEITITDIVKSVYTPGWGNYADSAASNQTVTTAAAVLSINALKDTTESDYLPLEIRGDSELWDDVNNKITPIGIGDSYSLRLDITIAAKTGLPTYMDLVLDIGVGAGITIPIVNRIISLPKTPPYSISVGFPIFSLATFVTNGGRLFVSTDAGTVDISDRSLFIGRTSSNI